MRVVAAFHLLLVALLAANFPSQVSADLTVVSYINGELSTADTAAVEQVVASLSPPGGTRRALRNQERSLWSAFCDRACVGWPKNQCFILYSRCVWRGRRMTGIENEEEEMLGYE